MATPTPADGASEEPEVDHLRSEVWREGITMALYISLSQLAVMAAVPTVLTTADADLALTTLLTSVGLIFAHQVAFRMSSRLVASGSVLGPEAPRLLRAQLVGGGAVTLLAVLPIWILGPEAYRLSMLLLLLFVMLVGYAVARSKPVSRLRALTYVAFVAVIVMLVLAVKSLVSH